MDQTEVFEEIYRNYLDGVGKTDLDRVAAALGLSREGEGVVVPFLGVPHRVSPLGITDAEGRRPIHSVSVILCRYVIMCPESEPMETDWVTYKDFRDAAPFAGGFMNNAERPIGLTFQGRISDLEQAGRELKGRPFDAGIAADLVWRFDALPKVPLLMVFNDRDEDFPAQCTLLFERRAEKYLDMECLAMMGWVLSAWLKRRADPQ